MGCVLLLTAGHTLRAQDREQVRVIPKLEHSTIRIGEEVKLNVRVVYPRTEMTRLVLPEDTLVHGVELVQSRLVDSLIINDRLQEMIYEVTLTSFDSATYQLRNISALVGDSLYTATEAPNLIVNTVPVDMEHPDQYADIKDQWKPAFVWQDYLMYLYILLGLIALGLAAYYLARHLKKRQTKGDEVSVEEPLLDPYEEAVQGMQALKQRELWEHNQTKQYYTEMTDILRRYLYRVYGMETLDKTSNEILEAFRTEIGKERMYAELSKILGTADLAKFAKYQPEADENIGLLSASMAFIEEHKPKQESTESAQEGGETL